ncbi:hypothetical protein ADU59_19760 [Pararhizobium polonicum]|jgi:hypothetical protein|uniref:Uncharacterized protein n=1 Tax=Pararhizobium polonicum TaxID=1612624 RepID=A0A1C7NY47_9HYPH|nr:hypothetical protein [Pararhizobium polonicum]OBZ93927.1 hypothetical protein ADU59_19760 [Pararhizobium polonicum]
MRLDVIAATAVITLATATSGFAADDAPYAGSWDCGIATFSFTGDTYDSGEGPIPIRKVEKEDGNYILSFDDNYQIGLSSVTPTSMQWLSMESGDMFDCKRLKP